MDMASQLHIFEYESDPFSMDGAKVGILKETNEIHINSPLQHIED